MLRHKRLIRLLCCVMWMAACVASAGADALDARSVWLYLSLDDTLEPTLPVTGVRRIDIDGQPRFGPGVASTALRVGADEPLVDIIHGLDDFPVARGSMALWFKPNSELGDGSRWLVEGRWASFSIAIEGTRLLAYATGRPAELIAVDLKSFEGGWVGRWRHVVLTWDDGAVRLFLDGQLAAERNGCAAFDPPHRFALGHIPGSMSHPQPRGVFDGWVDEFAVFRSAMSEDVVSNLYRQGDQGLLATVGGTVRVRMTRRAYLRGEVAKVTVDPLAASGDEIVLDAVTHSGRALHLATLPVERTTVSVDTGGVRPGRYTLRCRLMRDGAVALTDERSVLAVRSRHRPAFPVGIDGLRSYGDDMLERVESWHITHTSEIPHLDTFHRNIDRMFSYGIEMFPNLNIHYHKPLPFPGDGWYEPTTGRATSKLQDEVLQILVEYGDTTFTPATFSLCSPFSPIAMDAMKQHVRNLLAAADGHPGLRYISFNDEYSHRIGRNPETGKLWLGDYSPSAIAHFKQRTGLDPVFPPDAEPGTVFPDDHPYFKWRDVIGIPGDYTNTGLSADNAALTQLVHELRPDIATTSWSGGEYGYCDAVMDYRYPTIWQPHPGYHHGFGRLDYAIDLHRARQRVRPLKPVWGLLGWWSHDLAGQPDWCVEDLRINTAAALAKGVKLITWHGAWHGDASANGAGGVLSRADLRDEMIHWAKWIHQYGPMFAALEAKPRGKVAVLYSEDNRVGQIVRQHNPIDFNWFYPCLRIAGADVDLLTDRHVHEGRLDEYEALVLCAFDYASQSLWSSIREFAATEGKTVFVDEATHLVPEGAVNIGFKATGNAPMNGRKWGIDVIHDTYDLFATKLRDVVTPRLSESDWTVTGSNFVAPMRLEGRDIELYALVNYHVFDAQSMDVALRADGVLYDLTSGEIIARGSNMRWRTTLGKGQTDWYALLPAAIGGIDASLNIRDDRFEVEVRARDIHGKALAAPLPLRVEVFDPQGNAVEAYARCVAIDPDAGVASVSIPVAKRMDAPGEWSVVVTELVSRRTTRVSARLDSI